MSVIYKPKGKAGEYAGLALNVFTRCPHGCTYCFGPAMMRVSRSEFSKNVIPRDNLLSKLETDLKRGYIKTPAGKVSLDSSPIHLCFVCDPYPFGVNTQITRDVIRMIKDYGYSVQILTKSGMPSTRDFDLLDESDWYGFSFTGYDTKEYEPYAADPRDRIAAADLAIQKGIKTWVSCEPVIKPKDVEGFLKEHGAKYDLVKIGKPNYAEFPYAPEDWIAWGRYITAVCQEYGVNAVLKKSLKE